MKELLKKKIEEINLEGDELTAVPEFPLARVGEETLEGEGRGIVVLQPTNARVEPKVDSHPICSVGAGKKLSILAEENGWYQVSTVGRKLWINGEYARKI